MGEPVRKVWDSWKIRYMKSWDSFSKLKPKDKRRILIKPIPNVQLNDISKTHIHIHTTIPNLSQYFHNRPNRLFPNRTSTKSFETSWVTVIFSHIKSIKPHNTNKFMTITSSRTNFRKNCIMRGCSLLLKSKLREIARARDILRIHGGSDWVIIMSLVRNHKCKIGIKWLLLHLLNSRQINQGILLKVINIAIKKIFLTKRKH